MNKIQFDQLVLSEQISILREHAEYIGSRVNAASRLYIYALGDFYIELKIGISESDRINFFIKTLDSPAINPGINYHDQITTA